MDQSVVEVSALSATEARAQIGRIRLLGEQLWYELRDFYEQRGWVVLGYASFAECVKQELGMTERRAFYLLDAANIKASLDSYDVVATTGMLSSHAVELKPLPPPLRIEVAKQVDFSQTSVRELRKIVREAKVTLEAKVEEQKAARPVVELPAAPVLPDNVSIRQGDAAALPLFSESVDLIVTSPPYGLDKAYGSDDDPAHWEGRMSAWLTELYRVTRPGGRLALNVPLDTARGGERPTYAIAVSAAFAAGWRYRSTIVWNEGNVTHSTGRGSVDSPASPYVLAPVEMIPLFSKGDWKRGGDRSDLTHAEWLEWTNGLWTFGGESRPWEGHPAPFPEELPRRLIKLLSYFGDTVLDPFCGSGTTAVVAMRLGRRFCGFDVSSEYVASAQRRVARVSDDGQ